MGRWGWIFADSGGNTRNCGRRYPPRASAIGGRRLGYVVVKFPPESSSSRLRKNAVFSVLNKLKVVVSSPISRVSRTIGSQPPS